MAVSSLITSLKASLVIIYLQADALTGFGATSRGEISKILSADDEANTANTNATIYATEEKLEAEWIYEGFLNAMKAMVAGGTLNLFTLITVVMVQTAHISFEDVMRRRIILSEGILAVLTALSVVATLIYLGLLQGKVYQYLHAFWIPFVVVIVVSLTLSGMITRSISSGDHPYYRRRKRRWLDNTENQKHQQQEEQMPILETV